MLEEAPGGPSSVDPGMWCSGDFPPKHAFTIANDRFHFSAQRRHIGDTFAQTTGKLVKFRIAVEFQFIKIRQIGSWLERAPLPFSSHCAMPELIPLARHYLNRTTAGQRRGLKSALQPLANIRQTDYYYPRRHQTHQTLDTLFQDTTVDKQFTKEIDQFIQLLKRTRTLKSPRAHVRIAFQVPCAATTL